MDKLKELLGDELYNSVVAKLGTTKVVIDDGKLIPKHRLDEVLNEKKTLEDAVTKHEADLKALKEQAAGNEKLLTKITALETERDTAKAEAMKVQTLTKKQFALKEALLNAGVSSEKARNLLAKEFDIEKLEVADDGSVKGFSDMLKPIKEDKTFASMFGTAKIEGNPHNPAPPPTGEYFTRQEIESMTKEQLSDPKVLEKVNKSLAHI